MKNWIVFICVGSMFMVSAIFADDETVLRIGDKAISIGHFEEMARGLRQSGYMHIEVLDHAGKQELLDGVIARELLIMEGARRGYDRELAIAEAIDATRRKETIRKLYEQEAVRPEYVFSERELRSFFVEKNFDTEVYSQHIVCKSEEEAREVIDKLKGGASFASLVHEHSVPNIQQRFGPGGWVGWFKIGDLFENLKAPLSTMDPGSLYPEPVRTHVGFHVFRLKERRPVDFAASREWVESQALLHARAADMERYVGNLRQRYGLDFDFEVFAALRKLDPGLSAWPEMEDRVLLSWRDGQVSARDYMAEVERGGAPHPARADSALLYKTMDNLAGKQIMATEARALGLDRDPQVIAVVDKERSSLMVKRLFEVEVRRRVGAVTEAEARAFYEENIDEFIREDGKVSEFEFLKESILGALREKAKAGAMDEVLAELKEQYDDQIEIWPAALDRSFADGDWGLLPEDTP